jgi:hypothetical protein
MEPVQQPYGIVGYSQLDLSRPSSYSVAGRAADTAIQATKYPQAMLYSADRGLGESNAAPNLSRCATGKLMPLGCVHTIDAYIQWHQMNRLAKATYCLQTF